MAEVKAPAAGVGQTAIFVAWVRQMESRRPDALFRDPLAEAMLTTLARDPVLADVAGVIEQTHRSARGFPEYFAVRTRFFDDEVRAALGAGIRQVVTLAAGLDGRTVRLDCPPGTRWYELDLPEMTALKESLIERSGLPLACERRGVAADLTGDWGAALRAAGFDPGQPTAWLIEGLLMYLDPAAGEALLAAVTRQSAPGSRVLLEHLTAAMLGPAGKPARDRVESQGAAWLAARDDLVPWLAGHGWQAAVFAGDDPRISHGRPVAPLPACWLASASLPSAAASFPSTGKDIVMTHTAERTAGPEAGPTTIADTAAGHDELVGRAAALRESLWQDAGECDRERRLAGRDVAGITGAGLTRLLTPREFGGHGASMRTFLAVTTELGRGCCSAAWVTGVLNAGNFVASLFPAQAQAEVWADDRDATAALVLGAPTAQVADAPGGVTVTGQWAYASGILHSDWVSVMIPRGPDSPDFAVHLVLVPRREVEIRDTWFFTGMRGTGSNTVVADGLFVPRHRILPLMPLVAGETDGLVDPAHRYRNSLMGLFAIGLLGAQLGGADRALSFVREHGPGRPVAASTYRSAVDSPTFQLGLASAATLISTAELLAANLAQVVDEHAAAGANISVPDRVRARMDSTQVAQNCRDAIGLLLTAYGSSAFSESSPLQRIWRDVSVASRHAGFGMGIPHQLHGRALVGGDPRAISFLV
jgi:3-hydroxy-9,10-secoandrosta-1,3,5(10)-triene-9,17-dione monooxygenase